MFPKVRMFFRLIFRSVPEDDNGDPAVSYGKYLFDKRK